MGHQQPTKPSQANTETISRAFASDTQNPNQLPHLVNSIGASGQPGGPMDYNSPKLREIFVNLAEFQAQMRATNALVLPPVPK